jgi:hypothetical protein
MKLLMENWREFINEEPDAEFKNMLESKIIQNYNKVNEDVLTELEIDVGGLHISTGWEKWAALTGISAGAMSSAVAIASMYAGWEGVAIVLIPALLPVIFNPVVLAVGAGIGLRFKLIRKMAAWVFKKFIGKENVQRISETITAIIDKMVESSDGALDRASAMQLYGKIALWILRNEEFRSKLKEMFQALKAGDTQRAQSLSDELDEIIQDIIQNEILEPNDLVDSDPLDDEIVDNSEEPEKDIDIPHRGATVTDPRTGQVMHAKGLKDFKK